MNKLIILFISALTFVFITDFVMACRLVSGTFTSNCTPGNFCTSISACGPVVSGALDFTISSGGCALGCAAGKLYTPQCDFYIYKCVCDTPEAKWKTTCSEGEICKLRWNWDCGGVFEGKWDPEESSCVQCSGSIQTRKYTCDNTGGTATNHCEEACRAPSVCDEKSPNTNLPDSCGTTTLEVSRICSSTCAYISTIHTCNSANCGVTRSCGGSTYHCVYDGGWKWSTSRPSRFCCKDGDCTEGYACDTSTYRCRYTCVDRTHCAAGYCCEREIDASKTACVAKGAIRTVGGKSYICTSSSPGKWIECNEKNVGAVTEIDGVKHTCSLENGSHEWVAQTRRVNVLEIIFQFFRKLFS